MEASGGVRGVLLGTRNQFKDIVRFVEEKGMAPMVDDVVFELEDMVEAYERWRGRSMFRRS